MQTQEEQHAVEEDNNYPEPIEQSPPNHSPPANAVEINPTSSPPEGITSDELPLRQAVLAIHKQLTTMKNSNTANPQQLLESTKMESAVEAIHKPDQPTRTDGIPTSMINDRDNWHEREGKLLLYETIHTTPNTDPGGPFGAEAVDEDISTVTNIDNYDTSAILARNNKSTMENINYTRTSLNSSPGTILGIPSNNISNLSARATLQRTPLLVHHWQLIQQK